MSESAEQDLDYSNLIRAQTRQVDIDAFKERGMKKVNVINAKKINELISQAVTNIIGRMEDADIQTIKDDKAQIVMDSMDEFKRLFSEQKKEAEHQGKLQEEIELLRQALAQQEKQGSNSASNVQVQEISDQVKELKAFISNQLGKSQSNDMTRTVVMEKQSQLLEEHFAELKEHLAASQGTNVEKALSEAVDKMTTLLEKQEKSRNGAGNDTLLQAFGELRGDLDKRFTELTSAIRESGSGLRDDIKKANAEGLKAEIAALRADLEQKTIAAGAASTEALQAQLAQMQEMMAKGGGGGGPSGDLNDIVSKLEGSMSRKLAEAGIGKVDVSADDAYAASGVMLGAAFKDMDNIESNIEGLDAKKTVDKGGAKKAKGALDALKKLKGKK